MSEEANVNRKWYSGMLTSEDWWSVWLGLIMVVLGLFSIVGLDLVGWVAEPKTWVDPSQGVSVASYDINPLLGIIITYLIFTGLTTIGAACMKWDVSGNCICSLPVHIDSTYCPHYRLYIPPRHDASNYVIDTGNQQSFMVAS